MGLGPKRSRLQARKDQALAPRVGKFRAKLLAGAVSLSFESQHTGLAYGGDLLRGLDELDNSRCCWFVDSARVETKWGQTPEGRPESSWRR